ncbi:FAD-dependent oxidoreductase, partial [Mycobacterium tuberculosis]|nr:FAD-dependent oxidoreductase [Mycobacterium tuberculosis]
MTTSVKNIIIGFGKAGKTLAGYLGSQGEETILIEKSKAMYGGTCINVGCIPTKKLATKAARKQYSTEEASTYYAKSVQEKKALISALNQANYNKVDSVEKTTIIDGTARFV